MLGAEYSVWCEQNVFQHERKLPVYRHTLPSKLPERSNHRVRLPLHSHYWLPLISNIIQFCSSPLFRFCLKNCPPNDLECALSPYALEYKLLSLPFGIAANQDLIRLVAYTQDGVVHPRTSFLVVDEDTSLPFALRDENLKGVLFTTRPLREPHTYRMKVRALSYGADGGIEYQTTFIVYIAVSAYPY